MFTLCIPYVLYILNFILQGGDTTAKRDWAKRVGNYCDYCDKFEYMLSIYYGLYECIWMSYMNVFGCSV